MQVCTGCLFRPVPAPTHMLDAKKDDYYEKWRDFLLSELESFVVETWRFCRTTELLYNNSLLELIS